jgi:hypothetical protein
MDNKYGLGSSKVQLIFIKKMRLQNIGYVNSNKLPFCPTMQDHQCENCGEWQNDVPLNYSTDRSKDY